MFGKNYFDQLILLFSLFLLLFMSLIAFFGTIHGPYCTILINFYLYLQYFQLKVFSFNKISGFQTDLKYVNFLYKFGWFFFFFGTCMVKVILVKSWNI